MSKKIGATSKSIGQLLGRYERRPVVLPQFQRPYSWDKPKVLAFWEDLASFKITYDSSPTTASYYLGAIVVIDSEEQLLLLDGQQRLATATILLASIRDAARQLASDSISKASDLARDIQRELIEKTDDPISYSLTLGELDQEHFKKSIQSDPPIPHEVKLRSHQAIANSRALCGDKVRDMIHGLSLETQIKRLKSLADALTKGMNLIEIQVPSEEDAVQIFETLNDRGLRLSVPDLVLNLLMKRASDKDRRKTVRDQWNEIIRSMGRRDVARFLRHFWVSYYGDVKSQSLFAEIKKRLESENMDSAAFSEMCSEECETYVSLLDIDIPCDSGTKSNLEGLVKYFDVSNALPLLLAGYRCLNPADFAKLVKAILVTYIRYSLICNQNPLEFETALYRAAREVREASRKNESSAKAVQLARTILKELHVGDADVKSAAGSRELERSEAQWLLTQLANSMQTKTKELAMANCNLEHILPVKPAAEWGDVTDLAPFTWRLGNLTVLSEKLNSAAQNKKFETKKDNYYAKSEVKMTQELCKLKNWNAKEVEARGKELGMEIARIWPPLQ